MTEPYLPSQTGLLIVDPYNDGFIAAAVGRSILLAVGRAAPARAAFSVLNAADTFGYIVTVHDDHHVKCNPS